MPLSTSSRWFALIPVAAASAVAVLAFVAMSPVDLISPAVPIFSDASGHAVGVWSLLQDPGSILPGGWSDAMLLGYPANQLYPPVYHAVAGVLGLVLPLGTAVKIAGALPMILLPFAALAASRYAALPIAVQLAAVLSVLPVLFDTTCSLCGSTIGSTTRGEYAYGWGMALMLVGLGLVDRLARTGRAPALTGLVVGVAAIAHPVTALGLAVGVVVILTLRRTSVRPVSARLGAAAGVAALLAASWWIPFLARREWMPVPAFEKQSDLAYWLLLGHGWWGAIVVVLAFAGSALAYRERWILPLALGVIAAASAAAIVVLPSGAQLENIRLWPLYNVGAWFLASIAVVVGMPRAVRWRPGIAGRPADEVDDAVQRRGAAIAAACYAVILLVSVGTTWGWWLVEVPATATADGTSKVAGVTVTTMSAGPAFVYGGAEEQPDWQELVGVKSMLAIAGRELGCGRLMWDASDPNPAARAPFGDSLVFEQSAIWTDGCITSGTGVYIDASTNSPAVFGTATFLSRNIQPPPGFLSFGRDLAVGVDRLETLGIRYLLLRASAEAEAEALAPRLVRVASSGGWSLWIVPEATIVAEPDNLPVVVGTELSTSAWTELATSYQQLPSFDRVPLAADGPPEWPRASTSQPPPEIPAEAAGVDAVDITSSRITFTVSRVGSPVVVNVTAYPGWEVSGADGWFRASPSMVVVVPTESTVELTRQRTPVDIAAVALLLAGLALAAGIAVSSRRLRRRPAADEPTGAAGQ